MPQVSVSKKNRKSKIVNSKSAPPLYRCEAHPDRIAVIATAAKGRCCWECYLPADVFERRYGSGYAKIYGHRFYDPKGPGYAGSDDGRSTKG